MKKLLCAFMLACATPCVMMQASNSREVQVDVELWQEYNRCVEKAENGTFSSDRKEKKQKCYEILILLTKQNSPHTSSINDKKIDWLIQSDDLQQKEIDNLKRRIEILERRIR